MTIPLIDLIKFRRPIFCKYLWHEGSSSIITLHSRSLIGKLSKIDSSFTFRKLIDWYSLLPLFFQLFLLFLLLSFLFGHDFELNFKHLIGQWFEEQASTGSDYNLLLQHACLHGFGLSYCVIMFVLVTAHLAWLIYRMCSSYCIMCVPIQIIKLLSSHYNTRCQI